MKKFVPYYDGVLDKLLPEDQLIPYQVGWAEYVAVPPELKKRKVGKESRGAIPGGVSTRHPAQDPTALPVRR